MQRHLSFTAFALLTANAAAAAAAEPCLDNFVADGNMLTGRTYKTSALISGVRSSDAFNRAYAFTAENGFTVLSASKEAGVISAAQSVSYGKGKSVPLTVTLKEEGGNTRVSLSYATTGGVMSPEDAIKRHFCMTIAAAAQAATQLGAAQPSPVAELPTAAATTRPTMRGFAMVTPEQQQALRREVSKSVPNDPLRALVADATPAIIAFIDKTACLADYTGASALNEHAAPGVDLGSYYTSMRPMRGMQYHNKAACLTVTRIHGWSAPANNALKFEVIYRVDDSGETNKLAHEVIRQSDGTWLFSR